MKRPEMLARLEAREPWDVLVIGGGATGLGIAVDAAARGYRTLLLEQDDFAKGTSSRSTKLIHGGVRYLQQGNVGLVLEALRERGLLTRNAPHLVHHLAFIVPNYTWWEAPFYGIGLKFYDLLAGKLGLGPSQWLSREETLARLPTLEPEGLRGGTIYYDGQFDDSRLAIALARTAASHGATLLNYAPVIRLLHAHGLLRGAVAQDLESGRGFEVLAGVVINATGVFCDEVRRLDEPRAPGIVSPSQGVHLVLDPSFLPGDTAIMVPKTDDGRVLFAIPWHGRALIGTTDTPVAAAQLEPRPLAEEIEFLLTHAARYLTRDPTRADVLSTFAGLRPLRKMEGTSDTASMPRDHSVLVSKSGLVTVVGGKWTTYRKMAEDAVNQAVCVAGLDERPCATESLRLHGAPETTSGPVRAGDWNVYGTEAPAIAALAAGGNGDWSKRLHPALPYREAEVVWAVREEMARTVEDVLARRTRALLLDARASAEAAPRVAALMAAELGRDATWRESQVNQFRELAAGYCLSP
ncbi:MAG TPA: FAD-dependent oxidoreductase [Methylomirabilota bacterium]|nr:FAD-dependent oxidoreductase [Methylomirabilota bacterium]